MQSAGKDFQSPALVQWGQRLLGSAELYQQNQYGELLAIFNAILAESGLAADHRAISLAHRGETYRLMGRNKDALADFTRAIELNPNYAWAIGSRGQTYRQLGRNEDALVDFTRALELDPNDAWAIHNKGQVLEHMKRYEDAIQEYEKAILIQPKGPFSHNNLGELYLRKGELANAQAAFKTRVELQPEDSLNAHVALGVISWHLRDIEVAQSHFTQALAIWSTAWERQLQSPAELLENKAIALLYVGTPEAALNTLREALNVRRPDDDFDLYRYRLLEAGSSLPAALSEMMALIQQSDAVSSSEAAELPE